MRNGGTDRMAALWALVGVCGLFGFAIFRLGRRGVEAMAGGLTPLQWLVLAALAAGFVAVEGIMALQRRWVPRLVGRARELRRGRPAAYRILAPLYGMSLIGAAPLRTVRSWALVGGIVVAVVLVGRMPEPWRGIVDVAVAAALAWGLACVVLALPEFLESSPAREGRAEAPS